MRHRGAPIGPKPLEGGACLPALLCAGMNEASPTPLLLLAAPAICLGEPALPSHQPQCMLITTAGRCLSLPSPPLRLPHTPTPLQRYGITKEALRRFEVHRRPRWKHVMQVGATGCGHMLGPLLAARKCWAPSPAL